MARPFRGGGWNPGAILGLDRWLSRQNPAYRPVSGRCHKQRPTFCQRQKTSLSAKRKTSLGKAQHHFLPKAGNITKKLPASKIQRKPGIFILYSFLIKRFNNSARINFARKGRRRRWALAHRGGERIMAEFRPARVKWFY